MTHTSLISSPLGPILLEYTDTALVALRLPGQFGPSQEAQAHSAPPDHPIFAQTRRWLEDYFDGRSPDPHALPLAPVGTPFQRLIWELLLQIPYGQSATYGDLARQAAVRLGRSRMSAQAVGQAVGSNPISIVIPCHRCLGAGDRLTGYAGGLHLKRALLDHEGVPYH